MSGKRQPIELLKAKGKKHLTKDEIARREKEEVKVVSKEIKVPTYLPQKLRPEFKKLADRLFEIKIFTDLDVDSLARYVMAKDIYLKYSARLALASADMETSLDALVKLSNIQDKAFKQCRSTAGDLGLTISSRTKLAVPELEKEDDMLLKVLKGG